MEKEKTKKKKINHLNTDEVKQLLARLKKENQTQSHYYLQVAKRAKQLGVWVG